MFYTTDTVISATKLACLAPVAQQTFADSDLVTLINEELQITLVPQILSVREDFFLTSKTVSVTANVSDYRLPTRAIGNMLKAIYFLDANSNRKLIVHEDVEIKRILYSATTGNPDYFFFQGDKLTLFPTPSTTSGSLEIWYYQRPNQLVLTATTAKITAINTSGANQVFTVDTDLTGTISAGTSLDFLAGTSPFLLWAQDVACGAITATTITVTTTSVTGQDGNVAPQVGDYICLAQQANIPMIPQELHPLLPQMVASRLMDALGDQMKAKMVMERLGTMQKAAFKMIENRIENQPKRIIQRSGLLQASGFRIGMSTYR